MFDFIFNELVPPKYKEGDVVEVGGIHLIRLESVIGFSNGDKFDPSLYENRTHKFIDQGDKVQVVGHLDGSYILKDVSSGSAGPKGLTFRVSYSEVRRWKAGVELRRSVRAEIAKERQSYLDNLEADQNRWIPNGKG